MNRRPTTPASVCVGMRALIALLIFQLVCPLYAFAQAAPPSGGGARAPVNLDLTSTTASATAAHALTTHNLQSAVIKVGGQNFTVTPTSVMTPAQMMALYQVINTGQQSIQLATQGNAIGGTF